MKSQERACPVCGKYLSSPFSLKRHIACLHESKKEYRCEHCAKAFASNYHLNRHVNSKHTHTRHMHCTYGCKVSFSSTEARAYHHHTLHEGRTYPCPVASCSLTFSSLAGLRKHSQRPHHTTLRALQQKITKQKLKIARLKAVIKAYESKAI